MKELLIFVEMGLMASEAEEEYYPSPKELILVMNTVSCSSLPSLGISYSSVR